MLIVWTKNIKIRSLIFKSDLKMNLQFEPKKTVIADNEMLLRN